MERKDIRGGIVLFRYGSSSKEANMFKGWFLAEAPTTEMWANHENSDHFNELHHWYSNNLTKILGGNADFSKVEPQLSILLSSDPKLHSA